jgi:undecaprenyl-diphosphatase
LARGADRDFAVRFSLFLSIPAVVGFALLALFSAVRSGVNWGAIPAYILGALVAALTGYFSIQILRRWLVKGKLDRFAYYCWAVGALTVVLSLVL